LYGRWYGNTKETHELTAKRYLACMPIDPHQLTSDAALGYGCCAQPGSSRRTGNYTR